VFRLSKKGSPTYLLYLTFKLNCLRCLNILDNIDPILLLAWCFSTHFQNIFRILSRHVTHQSNKNEDQVKRVTNTTEIRRRVKRKMGIARLTNFCTSSKSQLSCPDVTTTHRVTSIIWAFIAAFPLSCSFDGKQCDELVRYEQIIGENKTKIYNKPWCRGKKLEWNRPKRNIFFSSRTFLWRQTLCHIWTGNQPESIWTKKQKTSQWW
jgi:hypothetical protein